MRTTKAFPSIILALCQALPGCQRHKNYDFDESKYVLIRKGPDENYAYVLLYANKSDTNLKKKEVFADSSYTNMLSKYFTFHNIIDGPYCGYVLGKIVTKVNFVGGQYDGEMKLYTGGKVTGRHYFNKGVKTGTWYDYDVKRNITTKSQYDDKGHLVDETEY